MTPEHLNAALNGLVAAEGDLRAWQDEFAAMINDIAYRRGLLSAQCELVAAADDRNTISINVVSTELTPDGGRLVRYLSDLTTQLVMINHAHGREIRRTLEAAKAAGPRFVLVHTLTDGEGDQ